MSTTAIIIIAVLAAVIVVGAAAAVTLQFNRRRTLHQRYGSEYDRTVEQAGSVRAGEADLRERIAARDELTIRPLTAEQADHYRDEWQRVQGEFVDTPSGSLRHADTVVTAIMADRGYPMSDFDRQAKLISVDHASVAENYRAAHATYLENEADPVSTDQLRDAIIAYRSLFDELIATDSTQRTTNEEQNNAIRSAS